MLRPSQRRTWQPATSPRSIGGLEVHHAWKTAFSPSSLFWASRQLRSLVFPRIWLRGRSTPPRPVQRKKQVQFSRPISSHSFVISLVTTIWDRPFRSLMRFRLAISTPVPLLPRRFPRERVPHNKLASRCRRVGLSISREVLNGLLNDAQITGIKSRLRLSSKQAEYWPKVEEALRDVARGICRITSRIRTVRA